MRYLLTTCFCGIVAVLCADTDTTRVRAYPDKMLLSPLVRFHQYSGITYSESAWLRTTGGQSWSVGARLNHGLLTVTGMVTLYQQPPQRADGSPDPAAPFRMYVHLVNPRLRFESYFQRTPSLYAAYPDTLRREPMRAQQWHTALLVPLRPQRFAMRGAHRLIERQLKSGGSPIVLAGWHQSDVRIVQRVLREWTASAGAGYGYTYVRQHFFASFIAAAAVAPSFQHKTAFQQIVVEKRLSADLLTDVRAAIGWQTDRMGIGFQYGRHTQTFNPLNQIAPVAEQWAEIIYIYRLPVWKPVDWVEGQLLRAAKAVH